MAVIAAGALTVTGLVSTAQAADVNNAKNAGFESGLANWSCSAGSGATVSTPVRSGTSALKATPAGQDHAKCTQTVAVKPNSTYALSSWVQGGYAYLGVTGSGTTDVSTWTPGSTTWTKLSTSFKTGANTTSVTVYTHGWYGQSAYFADDVEVTGPDGGGGGDGPGPASRRPPPVSPRAPRRPPPSPCPGTRSPAPRATRSTGTVRRPPPPPGPRRPSRGWPPTPRTSSR
ncbi:hypothetical protein SCYAM73S_00722 [Streptomyces cyaneofuscatus]